MEIMGVSPAFWQGKKVFLTGHTGFKGAWCTLWLKSMGADVFGYALSPNTAPCLYELAQVEEGIDFAMADIRDAATLKKHIHDYHPDIVLHFAAQSLVRYSYLHPIETYATNVMGTMNVLNALRDVESIKAAVFVTSDKCYENKNWLWAYREDEPLGGNDIYSSSKACSEIVIDSMRHSFFSFDGDDKPGAAIASVRAGNVIGGGDFASDRIIPDAVRAVRDDKPLVIRNPNHIRPWQHVLEPLSGYLRLAEKLYQDGYRYAEAWNFGPKDEDMVTVSTLCQRLQSHWQGKLKIDMGHEAGPYESPSLRVDSSKARYQLAWHPRWSLDMTLAKIVEWHEAELAGLNMKEVCLSQIKAYMAQGEAS